MNSLFLLLLGKFVWFSVELNKGWGGFFSWFSILLGEFFLSGLFFLWLGFFFGLLFGFLGFLEEFFLWLWCLDPEIVGVQNVLWHIGSPGFSWGIEWKSLLGSIFSFPGGVLISEFLLGNGFEVGVVFFDVDNVLFMGFEGGSLSLKFLSFVGSKSGSENLIHSFVGILLSFSSSDFRGSS